MLLHGVIAGTRRHLLPPDLGTAISTRAEFEAIALDPDGYYYLDADLDFSASAWTPFDFYGTLDGRSHSITGMTVTAASSGGVQAGLFKRIYYAQIYNLNLTGYSINNGTSAYYKGAIAGESRQSFLHDVYMQGTLYTGGDRCGGIIGYSETTLYSRTICTNTRSGGVGTRVGGCVGYNGGSNLVYGCVFNSTTWASTVTKIGETAWTTTTMQTAASYGSGWNTANVWTVADGVYPAVGPLVFNYVTTRDELAAMLVDPYANYKLGSNIDLSDSDWTAVPNFYGKLNGNGYVLTGLKYGAVSGRYGLFANMNNGASAQFLGLQDPLVAYTSGDSANYQGALAGAIASGCGIHNCYTQGGYVHTGGLRGAGISGNSSSQCFVGKCFASTAINGTTYTGGVGGYVAATTGIYNVQQSSLTTKSDTNLGTLAASDAQAVDPATYTARHWPTNAWVLDGSNAPHW